MGSVWMLLVYVSGKSYGATRFRPQRERKIRLKPRLSENYTGQCKMFVILSGF